MYCRKLENTDKQKRKHLDIYNPASLDNYHERFDMYFFRYFLCVIYVQNICKSVRLFPL